MNRVEIEKLPYWKSSSTGPDKWLEKTEKLIERYGGEVIQRMQGIDYKSGKSGFMITFKLEGDLYRISFPVFEPKNQNDRRAAQIQAVTMVYHAVKANLIASMILGARAVFMGQLLLKDQRTLSEVANPEERINDLFLLRAGEDAL